MPRQNQISKIGAPAFLFVYNALQMTAPPKKPRKGPALRHRSEKVALPQCRELSIAIISDTHSKAHQESAQHVAAQKPDLILHAGDIGDLAVLDDFKKIAPLYYVRGNIDERGASLMDSIDLSFEQGQHSVFKILLTHIAIYGVKLRAEVRRLAKEHDCKMVVCGHSHLPFIGSDRGISLINPGSIGPRRFGLPITFAMLNFTENRLKAQHVCCETGETWLP